MDTTYLVLGLALCLVGFAQAKYNITVFGNSTRTFDCPVPDGCPVYTEKFLTNYRYLNPRPTKRCKVGDIRTALIKFQEFNAGFPGVTITGECDNATMKLFKMSRCGCEDIVVEDDMKQKMMMMANNFYAPQAFVVGNTKWPKTRLTWKVTKYPRINSHLSNQQVDGAMRRGLDIWAKQTPLEFHQVAANNKADIDIKFERGRHTTREPFYDFDGRGSVLAHAFFPTSGAVHFDDDEHFVLDSDQGTELYIVAAHEFGHTLGISHSNINGALMAPYYRYDTNLQLHSDDIQAIQTLYGAGTRPEVVTTQAPPKPAPTTPKPGMPSYCDMRIQAAINVRGTTFVFTNDPNQKYKTIVYKVSSRGLDPNSKTALGDLFKKRSTDRWPRAHPYRVDAAAYIPDLRRIFLFSGTRVYRYTATNYGGPFYLDDKPDERYPRWMKVDEFPERPRAALAMPLGGGHFYMLIFGKTMVWDWDFESGRVGAWAYPISSFGRNMPTNVHTAFMENTNSDDVIFIKNDQYIRFNLRYRRVMDDENSVASVKKVFFKKQCM